MIATAPAPALIPGSTPTLTTGSTPATAPVGSGSVEDAVADAWIEHRDRLFAWIVRSTRDSEVASDVVSESFEALLREARAGRFPDNVGAWLHRVARNKVVDWSRRRARWAGHGLEVESAGDDPVMAILRREQAESLREALGTLSAAGRRAVMLEGEGYRPADIAPLLGRTSQATRTLLCRARRRMAVALTSTGA